MVEVEKVILSIIFLLLSLPNTSKEEESDWLYERNQKFSCQELICDFNISYNNPYSPMILGNLVRKALLDSYYYIYITFHLYYSQRDKIQNIFYLEAYDYNTDESLLSNGDCHLINLTNREEYELQFFKTIYNDSIIIIKFLGLNPQFFMEVSIRYDVNFHHFAMCFLLTNENSLYQSEINELKEYNEKMNKLIEVQSERKIEAIETANKIIFNLFGLTLKANLEYKLNTFSKVIPLWPFISLTITTATGVEAYSENILGPDVGDIILTKFFSVNSVIELGEDCFDTLNQKIELSDVLLNVIKIFNKKVNDIIFTIALDLKAFSLTIAVSPTKYYVSLTFRFFDIKTRKNFYEIQLKFELKLTLAYELVLANNEVLSKALNKAAQFSEKYSKHFPLIFIGIIIAVIILTLASLTLPLALSSLGSVALFLQSLIFKVPAIDFSQYISFVGKLAY